MDAAIKEVERIFGRLCAKTTEQQYQSPEEFVAALDNWLDKYQELKTAEQSAQDTVMWLASHIAQRPVEELMVSVPSLVFCCLGKGAHLSINK